MHMLKKSMIPVAQYLRMSTEQQKYSTANQSIAILRYAEAHGMEVVRTYADHGKSGISLATRTGLQSLLRDATANDADFKAVLVYDVSRWGRFQNPDEGASYEYRLQTANIPVHYCAEPFDNDGSLASSILKTLKRGMAGEYSRELSTKVWLGHRRITELGYKMGGYTGYGLRRQLVSADGTRKQLLHFGERKSLQSDHVILVPGPPEELAVITRIYGMFIEGGMTEREIAIELNKDAVPWIGRRPWTRMCIRHILTNPKYIGASVYNRTSFKLHKEHVKNPRDEWIWREDAFEPVVPKGRFEKARKIVEQRAQVPTPEQLLADLRSLIKRRGRPSERLIDATKPMASAGTYVSYFGSLRNAYRLAGWNADRQLRHLRAEAMVRNIQSRVISEVKELLSDIELIVGMDRRTCVVTVHSGIAFSVSTTRCSVDGGGRNYWHIYTRETVPAQLRISVRLTAQNDGILDYFIFPSGFLKKELISIGRVNARELNGFRFENLNFLKELLQWSHLEEWEGQDANGTLSIERSTTERPRNAKLIILRSAMASLLLDEDFKNVLRVTELVRIPRVLLGQTPSVPEYLALVVCESYVAHLLGCDKVKRFIQRRNQSSLKQR